MNLLATGTAFPVNRFTQAECLEAMKSSQFWDGLKGRSQMVLEKVLSGDSGIEKRHFALGRQIRSLLLVSFIQLLCPTPPGII